jgi:hypothetical protein
MINVNELACPQNHPCPAVQSCPVGAITQDDIFSAPHAPVVRQLPAQRAALERHLRRARQHQLRLRLTACGAVAPHEISLSPNQPQL